MEPMGIVSYGAYVPRYRITPEEIGKVWGTDGTAMGQGLNIRRKSVPAPDEDTITISTEALRTALARGGIDPQQIGAVYVGSESHPYAVKPTATVVAQAVGATPHLTAADFEFACKAGTAAIQTCLGLVGAGMVRYGVAIGTDTSQGAPGDALEYSASAGGAAFVIGRERVICRVHRTLSYTTDTPDFWRREGQRYPSHSGRFTGEPAYFRHVTECARSLFEAAGTSPKDYVHVVFHQPNGKFPQRIGKQLGFTEEQMRYGLVTPYIGNTYSGAALIGL
ncbi:MAG TPA: hydroxymethylglutaryl-CoA synthase, partial [Thermoplasmata archaeon]|nr:hydroxymethylglutaryl-CoA synthase [Thermoplasmata archaeon]